MDDIWTRAERWLSEHRGPMEDLAACQTICSIAVVLLEVDWEYCSENLRKIKAAHKEEIDEELIKRRLQSGS